MRKKASKKQIELLLTNADDSSDSEAEISYHESSESEKDDEEVLLDNEINDSDDFDVDAEEGCLSEEDE